MNFVVLETQNEDTRLLDQSVSRALAAYGGHHVKTLDPCAIYERAGSAGLEAEIIRTLEETRAQVFVCCAFGMWLELDPRFVYALEGRYRVYIVGDDEAHFDYFDRYNAQAYDLVLSANPLVERYHQYQIDADYYPSVYRSDVFSAGPESRQKQHDVSFIGAIAGKAGRADGIAALGRAGIPVTLYGPGTPRGSISNDGAISVYRSSRINLNFTGTARSPLAPKDAIVDRVRQVKGRCSKIALCGSFVLSEYAPGLERQFRIGEEIDVFDGPEELVDKVRYYLAHDEQREAMAARAHARAVAEYDERRYWARLSKNLEERAVAAARRRASGEPHLIDKAFWSCYGAYRFKYMMIFLFTGRLVLLAAEFMLLVRSRRFSPYAAAWFAATGLHIARQRSRLAAAVAAIARTARDRVFARR
jgi:hypothetical protein